MDLQGVGAVFGDFVVEDRVGMEEEVVGILDFPARGIGESEGGLKPAGDGVGDVGEQFARLGGDHDVLALGGLEAIASDAAGGDLPVDEDGQGDVGGRFRRGACHAAAASRQGVG